MPSCATFSTFFYAKLVENGTYDYGRVRRWTRRGRVDVFARDAILVPVHCGGNHWTLAVVRLRGEPSLEYDRRQAAIGSVYLATHAHDQRRGLRSFCTARAQVLRLAWREWQRSP